MHDCYNSTGSLGIGHYRNELWSLTLWGLAYGAGAERRSVVIMTRVMVMLLHHTSGGPLAPDFQLPPTVSHPVLCSFLLFVHSLNCLPGSAHRAYCLLFSYVSATS